MNNETSSNNGNDSGQVHNVNDGRAEKQKTRKPRKTLEELEKMHSDLQSKKKARSAKPATAPGVVAVAPSTRIDSDLRAKENALSSKMRSAQPAPASAASAGVTPGAQAGLSSLESSIARKIRGDRESVSQNQVVLGAVASAGPLPSKVEDHVNNPTANVVEVRGGVVQDSLQKIEDEIRIKEESRDIENTSENPTNDTSIDKSALNQQANPSNNTGSDQVEKWYDDDLPGVSQERNPFLPQTQPPGQDYIDGSTAAAMNEHDGNGDADFAPPVYQQAEFAGNDGGGIEAFVADEHVLAAIRVAVLKTPEEEEAEMKKKLRKYICYGGVALVLVMVVIITPIAVVFTGPVSAQPTRFPSVSPTDVPSRVPSTSPSTTALQATLNYLRSTGILNPCPECSDETEINYIMADDSEVSPQYLAAEWLADYDLLGQSIETAQGLQRYILAVFYFSTGGDSWVDCSRYDRNCLTGFSWLSNKTECQWDGVRCDEPGEVTRILIGEKLPLGNGLKGTIPSELARLTLLSSLTLVGGIFDGGQLSGTIPSELGLLPLESIYIQAHHLIGTIPNELLLNKTDMQMFAITNNELTGQLPTSVVNLPNLIELQLHGNNLTGSIPEAYGTMKSLEILELQKNDLEGTIPENLYELSLLRELSLEGNKLDGTISNKIENLDYLRIFSAGNNSLTGNLPETIFKLPELRVLRIGQNNMSGTLSEDFITLNNTLAIFEGYDNHFSGNFTDLPFDSMTRLRQLLLHGTNLTGAVKMSLCERRGTKKLRKFTVPQTVDCSVDQGCCDDY
mmetsp:Transcript_11641/g.17899  ORF Transcript_11641/g.17899 Transcript_11641/m.17899 type:complete len:793 (-) Transcript_11641:70-2448(-)|eukprot:CAMPEP_0178929122 /NCGR_PEP_ID=MMETSP0786-20121207/20356_1 /TAXON_ID=186022 /ORGANISM="Thalassionema frauenfeldii, Strain CCMP 1798" /LENGTH=792 /DNA_ID=CAMNT_0020605207 /DNA_START=255 /DNA_END=2636 /DNA_ORIENTATION=+